MPKPLSPPVLALDLGASRIRAAVVAADGRIVARRAGRTPGADGPAAVLDACIAHLRAVQDDADPGTFGTPAGIGLSAPGPVDPRAGTLVEPPNIGPGFRDVPFAAPIGAALGLPAALERDTHVAALAELAFGAARGCRDFLYLTVSTGFGGAIVVGGRLYGGPDGVAGELGHLPVDLDGPPCGCGGRGHIEAICSGSGIARLATEAALAGRSGALAAALAARGPGRLEGRDVADAAEAGDPEAGAILERARGAFAAYVVGLVNAFAPERIVVGGSLAAAQGERLLGPAREAVERTAFRIPRERVEIVPAALGDDVGLVGAVPLLALRRPAARAD
ncbi:MAG TPA: ROK family protein [Candidatus Limnocylindrales bacterium]|nr:ROK family protein [Candidatus Limnocylindrales bacterium]